MINLFSTAIAGGMTLFFISLLRPLSIRLDLVDLPGGRKQHTGQIPLMGGIAMFLGFAFALLTLPISLSTYRCLIACCALLVVTGVLDDFHELSPRARLMVQIVVALLMMGWAKLTITHLGTLFFVSDIHLGFCSIPFTAIAIVGIINAVNMTDGVDGLAGSLSFIEFSLLLLLAIRAKLALDAQILALLMASLLGFLSFNFPFPWRTQARVFMGDAGSMYLGFALVWFLISLSQRAQQAAVPATFLWIMAIPLFDVASVMLRRIKRRKSPFSPDREHVHHLCQALGFSTLQTTSTLSSLALGLGLVGITANYAKISEGLIFISFIATFAGYFTLQDQLWKKLANTKSIKRI